MYTMKSHSELLCSVLWSLQKIDCSQQKMPSTSILNFIREQYSRMWLGIRETLQHLPNTVLQTVSFLLMRGTLTAESSDWVPSFRWRNDRPANNSQTMHKKDNAPPHVSLVAKSTSCSSQRTQVQFTVTTRQLTTAWNSSSKRSHGLLLAFVGARHTLKKRHATHIIFFKTKKGGGRTLRQHFSKWVPSSTCASAVCERFSQAGKTRFLLQEFTFIDKTNLS